MTRTLPLVGAAVVLVQCLQCEALAPLLPLATAAPIAGAAALAAIAGGADMMQLLPPDQAAGLLQGLPPDEAVADAGVIAAGGAAYVSGFARSSLATGRTALTARSRKAESARDVLSDLGVIDQDAPALDSESSELDLATLAKALDRRDAIRLFLAAPPPSSRSWLEGQYRGRQIDGGFLVGPFAYVAANHPGVVRGVGPWAGKEFAPAGVAPPRDADPARGVKPTGVGVNLFGGASGAAAGSGAGARSSRSSKPKAPTRDWPFRATMRGSAFCPGEALVLEYDDTPPRPLVEYGTAEAQALAAVDAAISDAGGAGPTAAATATSLEAVTAAGDSDWATRTAMSVLGVREELRSVCGDRLLIGLSYVRLFGGATFPVPFVLEKVVEKGAAADELDAPVARPDAAPRTARTAAPRAATTAVAPAAAAGGARRDAPRGDAKTIKLPPVPAGRTRRAPGRGGAATPSDPVVVIDSEVIIASQKDATPEIVTWVIPSSDEKVAT